MENVCYCLHKDISASNSYTMGSEFFSSPFQGFFKPYSSLIQGLFNSYKAEKRYFTNLISSKNLLNMQTIVMRFQKMWGVIYGSYYSSPAGLGKMHYSFREMCKCSHGFVTPLLFMSSLFSIGKSKKNQLQFIHQHM